MSSSHYYIDGYNLLFRLLSEKKSLEKRREQIIYELNKRSLALNLNLSLVFDSPSQDIDTCSHYQSIEIIFTGQGESADDFILSCIKKSKYPKQETVVTSDKILAAHSRRFEAKTQSVEDFLAWVDDKYFYIIDYKEVKKIKPKIKELTTCVASSEPLPVDPQFEYYLRIFEENYQKLVGDGVSPKKQSSPRFSSENDRWLYLFEERLKSTSEDL